MAEMTYEQLLERAATADPAPAPGPSSTAQPVPDAGSQFPRSQGMTYEDLLERADAEAPQQQQQRAAPEYGSLTDQHLQALSPEQRKGLEFLSGGAKSIGSFGLGAADMVFDTIGRRPAGFDAFRDKFNRSMDELGADTLTGKTGGILTDVGAIATPVGAMKAATKTGGRRLATGTAAGAVAGSLEYTDEDESRLANTALGAAAGFGGSAVGEALGKGVDVARRVAKMSTGRVPVTTARAKSLLEAKSSRKLTQAEASDLELREAWEMNELLKEFDVRGTAGQVMGTRLGAKQKKIETGLDNSLFFSTRNFRRGTLDDAERAAELLQKTNELPNGWGDIMADRVMGLEKSHRKEAGRLYTWAAEQAPKDVKFDLGRMRNQIDRIADQDVSELPKNLVRGHKRLKKRIAELNNYRPEARVELNRADGSTEVLAEGEAVTFEAAEQIRKLLNNDILHLKGKPGADKTLLRYYTKIKDALDQDMERFATEQGGDLSQAFKDARNYYRTRVVPFDDLSINIAKKKGDPEDIYDTLVNPNKTKQSIQFYELLDDQGQQIYRAKIIDGAMKKARGGDGEGWSPAKFATAIEKMDGGDKRSRDTSIIGTVFRGDELRRLRGLSKVMRAIDDSTAFTANPMTGQTIREYIKKDPVVPAATVTSVLGYLGVTGGVGTVGGAAIGAGIMTGRQLALRWLATSDLGKKYLLQLNATQRDSRRHRRLMAEMDVAFGQVLDNALDEDDGPDGGS